MCVGGCDVNRALVQFQDEFRLINSVRYEQQFNHESLLLLKIAFSLSHRKNFTALTNTKNESANSRYTDSTCPDTRVWKTKALFLLCLSYSLSFSTSYTLQL